MATNAELYSAIQPQGEITGRVLAGLMKKAWAVLAENTETTNHANRTALAEKVMRAPESLAGIAWRLFLSNATARASLDDLSTLTDANIDWVWASDDVAKLYDALANMEA